MKYLVILYIVFACVWVLSCDDKKTSNLKNSNAEVKKGVTPAADPEIAVIEMENPAYGTIKLELYSNVAPKMVERFKTLAKEGYYDGIAFHRINQSVIQVGDSYTKIGAVPVAGKEGDSGKPNVVAEFSDVKYDTGIVGAARLPDPNSANSQFFITLKREQGFDNNYTVFGKVIEGMNNVMTISGVQPKEGDRPVEPVRIKHISIVPRN